jgi:glycosyltransferase involved in cell wall biosynthesis
MRIAVVANTTWYLYNFRLNLMHALMASGHEVVAVGPADAYAEKLVAAGVRHRAFPLNGAGVNPLRELASAWALYRVLRDESVQGVLSYTPKGNIYSALAAGLLGIATVPNVSGLGRVFIRHSPLTFLVRGFYRFTFRRARKVFFQNREDMETFLNQGLVSLEKAERIPGSGVDVTRFAPQKSGDAATDASNGDDGRNGEFVFLLVARMLWDKGVGEYVEAARSLKAIHPGAKFMLLGFLDVQNPSAIPRAQVEAWEAEGVVHYLGSTDDVFPFLREADCVVLPSYYREGVPRTLLEAAAMAKPIITTDAPGCRDTVDDGVTGLLCRLRDGGDLANKMLRMIDMNRNQLREMGLHGREKMVREFDEKIVIRRYLAVVEKLVC